MSILRDGGSICAKNTNTTSEFEENFTKNAKKSKRRTKAFKVKLQKMKNAELVERINAKKTNLIQKSIDENQRNSLEKETTTDDNNKLPLSKDEEKINYVEETKSVDKDSSKDELQNTTDIRTFTPNSKDYKTTNDDKKCNIVQEDECVLVDAIKKSILNDNHKNIKMPETLAKKKEDWKSTITNLPFVGANSIARDRLRDVDNTFTTSPKLYSQLLAKDVDMPLKFVSIIEYLINLLNCIIQEYNIQWQIDDELESKIFNDNPRKLLKI